jgi:hypothetical protein
MVKHIVSAQTTGVLHVLRRSTRGLTAVLQNKQITAVALHNDVAV